MSNGGDTAIHSIYLPTKSKIFTAMPALGIHDVSLCEK